MRIRKRTGASAKRRSGGGMLLAAGTGASAKRRSGGGMLLAAALVIAAGFGGSASAVPIPPTPSIEHGQSGWKPIMKTAENSPKETRDEKAAASPTKDDPPVLPKEFREYLAYQVAEDVKAQLIA